MIRVWIGVLFSAFYLLALPSIGVSAAVSDVYPAPRVAGLHDLGRAPASRRINLALTLKTRHDDELSKLISAQSDETSPLYAHYLTSRQFNEYFGPAVRDYAYVLSLLRLLGFSVTHEFSNHTVIDVSAPVRTVERTFDTEMHDVLQPGARGVRYANMRPARVPSELRSAVLSVAGLNDLRMMHADFRSAGAGERGPVGGGILGPPLHGPQGGFGPFAFVQGYDMPVQHGFDGTGRVAGIVIDADWLDSDLTSYLSYFGVTRTGSQTRVLVDGGPPPGLGSPDSLETSLDIETIASQAPGANVDVYEFPSFDNAAYVTDAYNAVVSDNLVDTANSSFGGCELDLQSYDTTWNAIAKQGASLGITFHASSGDLGNASCYPYTGTVQAPASAPYFTAVGGTSLAVSSNGNYSVEAGWIGGGGGVSQVFPLPAYQRNVPNITPSGRNVPDLSFDADPRTGTALYYAGSFLNNCDPCGGTSLSSPILGAYLATLDEMRNQRAGQFNVTLYHEWLKHGYSHKNTTYLHDIIYGGNGYNAGPGYDLATGIGSADGFAFARLLQRR